MCTLYGCPSTLLFNPRCSGTSSRCTYLFASCRGYSLRSNRRLLSWDAFSVFSIIRMVRARLAKVCVSPWSLCENKFFSFRNPQCSGIMSNVETCMQAFESNFLVYYFKVIRLWGRFACEVIRLCSVFRVQSTTAVRNASKRLSLTSLVYLYLITCLLF